MSLSASEPTAHPTSPARDPGPSTFDSPLGGGADRSAAPTWPLAIAFLGMPLWWLLGVWQLMFFAMAVPMVRALMTYRTTLMPRGFGVWFMWLAWLLTGLFVMQVDAPGTVSDSSVTAYLPFAYRWAWYVAATVVALYIINARPRISSERIARILAWLFVILVIGGLLGRFAPDISFPSALQSLLPRSLAKQSFVRDLLQVQVAQVQTFLGAPQARPSAPFPYTNDWGLVTACTLPFFVAAWWNRSRPWRLATVVVMVVAGFTIVSSLNRGMWIAIVVMAGFLVLRSAVLGKVRLLVLATVVVVVAAVLVPITPLGDLVQARLDNPHSDQVRSNLGLHAAATTAEGSPVIGFGTTRDIEGNFVSIAGGATDDCPNCAPPPLGTHGQLWLIIFGAGFAGAALYIVFLVGQLLRGMGARSPYGVAALCTLLTLTITLPIYSAVGIGLYIGFVSIGILAKEHGRQLTTVQAVTRPLLRRAGALVVCVLLGGLGGALTHAALGSRVVATQRLFIPDADLGGVPGTRVTTLDTEALLATSNAVVDAVASESGMDAQAVRTSLWIGAETNTRVLVVSYTSKDQEEAVRSVETASRAYLRERQALIATANRSLEGRLTQQRNDLSELYREIYPYGASQQNQFVWSQLNQIRERLDETGSTLLDIQGATTGESISAATVTRSSDQAVVRIGSGLAIGFLLGVPLILVGDRFWLRFGGRQRGPAGAEIPVIAHVLPDAGDDAIRTLRSYPPVCGVIADPDHASAVQLASHIDENLERRDHTAGRAVYVVAQESRVSRVRRLYQHYADLGVEPMGVIVCKSTKRSGRSR